MELGSMNFAQQAKQLREMQERKSKRGGF